MSLVSPHQPPVLPRVELPAWLAWKERLPCATLTYDPTRNAGDENALLDHLVTEDEQPVDNLPSAKQQRLLVETLYSSWPGPTGSGVFLADANIGMFSTTTDPPLVPDVFLSLHVQVANDWWQKRHRSYFLWEFRKPPEVVIEIVSNREGQEDERKLRDYARLGSRYYVIFDPTEQLQEGVLRIYELRHGVYVKRSRHWLPAVGLGLTLWRGTYEGKEEVWLRWCEKSGTLLPTGAERATQEYLRAEQERQRADYERQRAEQEQQRAEQEQQRAEQEQQRAEQEQQRANYERQRNERLVAQLRALGIEPEA